MKNLPLSLLALALLCGAVLADGQQTTYDSLNVRVVWTLHAYTTYGFGRLVMAEDTTLWSVYVATDTLVKIDASNPDAIDASFYAMDSLLTGVEGIIDDSLLLAYYYYDLPPKKRTVS